MTARLALVRGRVLPNGWVDLLRQCSLFGGAYLLYRLVEGIVGGNTSVAFAHARELISLERSLHIFVEPAIQGWATSGNLLFVGMAIGLIGYGLFPTAPPRFLPEWGFIDSINVVTGGGANSTIANVFFNPYAAVPSMHVACAVMLGWTLSRLVRRRAAKVFWAMWPVFITFMTVITGNHFLIDAVLGLVVAAISFVAARRLAALRPHAWTFGSSGQSAQPSAVPAT